MAKKRFHKKTRRTKRTHKKGNGATQFMNKGSGLIGADEYHTKLTFRISKQVTSMIQNTSLFVYGNNAYDPDPAIGNLGCPGFDKLAQLYKAYVVTGSKISIDFNNNLATGPVRVGLVPATAKMSTYVSPMGQSRAKISPSLSAVGGMDRGHLSYYMSTARIFGTTKQQIAKAPEFKQGTDGSNYTNTGLLLWYWNVTAESPDTLNNGVGVTLSGTITYYVTFQAPIKVLAPSLLAGVVDINGHGFYAPKGSTGDIYGEKVLIDGVTGSQIQSGIGQTGATGAYSDGNGFL